MTVNVPVLSIITESESGDGGSAVAPVPRETDAVRRLHHALAALERSIDAVRDAANVVAAEQGAPFVSLRLLDGLQRAIRNATPGACGPEQPAGLPVSATVLALDALWEARKKLRRVPSAAVERLGAVDLEDVDPRVVQEVYGTWLKQCRRLGLANPFKHDAGFGRGALLVPVEGGGLRVVSSIGMPEWPPGTRLAWRDVPGARALE